MTARRVVLILVAALLAAGCGPREIPPPRAEPTLREDLPAELAEAVRVREAFGLRADPEYVADVAVDPDATTRPELLGIPLLPHEVAEIERRFASQDRMGDLAAYGAEHPDEFGGMYIDQQAGGDVMLLFTGSLDRHRVAVAALAPPGVSVRVRRVDFTEQELTDLLDSVMRDGLEGLGFQPISGGVDVIRNVVTLEGRSNVPGIKQLLEARHPGMLDVTVHPVPGPWANATEGDGWRLIANGETGSDESQTVRVAVDRPGAEELWRDVGLPGVLPNVDIEREFLASFGYGHGSTCREVQLEAIVVAADERLIHARVTDPMGPRACTTDLVGAHVFVVAVERAALGAGDVTVRLHEERTCDTCEFQEEVTVQLD